MQPNKVEQSLLAEITDVPYPPELDGMYVLFTYEVQADADGRFAAFCDKLGLATCSDTPAESAYRLWRVIDAVLSAANRRGELIGFFKDRGIVPKSLNIPELDRFYTFFQVVPDRKET